MFGGDVNKKAKKFIESYNKNEGTLRNLIGRASGGNLKKDERAVKSAHRILDRMFAAEVDIATKIDKITDTRVIDELDRASRGIAELRRALEDIQGRDVSRLTSAISKRR